MKEVSKFICTGDNLEEIPESIVLRTGLNFPEVHTKGEYMALLSKELKKYRKDNICRVPFCVTVEAEALGACIKLGNSKIGPRVENYIFNSIEDMKTIKEITLGNGRIKEVLKAVKILNDQGEITVLSIEGPFTISASLIDSSLIYKAIRKNRDLIDSFMKVIEDSIVKYIKEGIKCGAKIISYGDPVGALDIVGPKIYKDISGKITYNILKRIENELDGAIIHLCGKTSTALESLEFIELEPIKYEEELTYGQSIDRILKCKNDVKFIGHNCIKRTSIKIKDSTVWSAKLL